MPDIVLNVADFQNPWCPPVPQLVFADTFSRPDASSLGSTEAGRLPWQLVSNTGAPTGVISDGHAGVSVETAGVPYRAYAMVDVGDTDGILRARATDFGPSNQNATTLELVARATDWANLIAIRVASSDGQRRYVVSKRISGSQSTIANTTHPSNPGDLIEVTYRGDALSLSVNRAPVISVDIAGVLPGTPTLVGFGGYPTTTPGVVSLWDDVSYTIPGEWL